MTMEFLEGGSIWALKGNLKKYYDDHENETLRNNVDKEVTALIELADKHRKDEDLLHSVKINFESSKIEEEKA